jgi:hypothetical protein
MIIGQSQVAMWHNLIALIEWLKQKKSFGKIFRKIQMIPHVTFLGYHV